LHRLKKKKKKAITTVAYLIKSLFEIAFKGFQSTFNTQKSTLKKKKKTSLVKQLKTLLRVQKILEPVWDYSGKHSLWILSFCL
jgi:hypothetical protein